MNIEHFKNIFECDVEIETKTCSICLNKLPLDCFGFDSGSNYKRHECKSCAREQRRIVAKIKKAVLPPSADHRCPICEKNEAEKKAEQYGKPKDNVWVADHDHATGQFRDWLCQSCNLGIGNLKDNAQFCKNASDYLEKHDKT